MCNMEKELIGKGKICGENKKQFSWKIIRKMYNIQNPKRKDKESKIWLCEGLMVLFMLMGMMTPPRTISTYQLIIVFVFLLMHICDYLLNVILAVTLNLKLKESYNDEIYQNEDNLEIRRKDSVLVIALEKNIVIWEYNENIVITRIKEGKIKAFLYAVQLEDIDCFRIVVSEKVPYTVIEN